MERVITATEARVRFGELLRRVVGGEGPVIVEKDGKAQVAVLSMAEYARLKSRQEGRPDWEDLVDRAHRVIAAEVGKRQLPDGAQVIREMREERDAQLLDTSRLR